MNVDYIFYRDFVILFVFLFLFLLKINVTLIFYVCLISCRFILIPNREWTCIHHISVPFKDNKCLNKRWDKYTYPFCEQFLNGNLFSIGHISLESNDKIIINEKQNQSR